MASVHIKSAEPNSNTANNLTKEINDLIARVRHRAYHIFQARGCQHGNDVADWLRAEEELLIPIGCTVKTTDAAYELSLSIHNINPTDVEIYTIGDSLIVKSVRTLSERECIVNYSDEAQSIFFQWQIPEGSVMDEIKAKWENDLLIVTIPRASAVHEVKLLPSPVQARGVAA